MPRYSACIEMLFNDLPQAERAEAAKKCGYQAIEFWHWHRWNIDEMKDSALPVALALTSSADERVRDEFARISMFTKESPALFKEFIQESFESMAVLKPDVLCVGPMQLIRDMPIEEQEKNMIECLRAVKPIVDKYKTTLAIEPLNPLYDHAGCYPFTSEQAYRIVRAGGEGFGVLFDIYHQQITEGNLINNISKGIDVIQHFHVADVPGRHEPGTGEINFTNVIKHIDSLGYKGYVGCEFMPTTDAAEASKYILCI